MASHVIIIDSRARQTRIATTPATHLSDVLQQSCQKLGLDASLFILKYNDKVVDLSRPIRHAGLPSGAQLQLVQGSRSPTVITVAVQIPHMEASRRVTEKVPSSYSIWQILRLLETKEKLNFTQRAVGNFDLSNASSGAGRMYYEMPVVNVVHRDLSTFADLQKTLTQLGITSGNVLMRLSFKVSEQPLEEAMADITQYFNEPVPELVTAGTAAPVNDKPEATNAVAAAATAQSSLDAESATSVSEPSVSKHDVERQSQSSMPESNPDEISSKSTITVYNAPTTNATTRVIHNDADYVPTTEHAAVHQARLQQSSRNTRLLSDAELAAKAKDQEAKLASVNNLEVRIRFPDLTQIKSNFERGSSAQDVYAAVRSQLHKPQLKFALRYVDSRGNHVVLPDDPKLDIITNAGWRGRVLANMEWNASVAQSERQGQVLASEVLKQAQDLPVPVELQNNADEKKGNFLGNLLKKDGSSKSDMTGAEKEDKLKKFLRFGKK